MATEVGKAYVTLLPSAKGFASKMQQELAGDIGKAGKNAGEEFGDKFSDQTQREVQGKGRKIFGGLGKLAAGALAGIGVGTLFKDALGEAGDFNEAMSKNAQIFGDEAIPALERFASTAASSIGQSKNQALDAASTFATFGKSAGLAGDDLVTFSTDLTSLASDLASFHNTSPEDAINALGAALRGESEPMRRYGVLLDDASLRQEAMRQGIVKNTKTALTPQQKVLAAQALIFKQTGDAQGDFARTSDGAANQQRILAAEFTNAKVALGQGLLPVLERLMAAGVAIAPVIATLATKVGNTLGPAFNGAVDAAKALFGWMSDHTTTVKVLAGVLGALVAVTAAYSAVQAIATGRLKAWFLQTTLVQAATKAWAAVQWVLNAAMSANPLTLVVVAVVALIAVIAVVVKKLGGWSAVMQKLSKLWESFKGVMSRAWDSIKNAVVNGVSKVVNVVKGLPGKAMNALRSLGSKLSGFFSKVWNTVKNVTTRLVVGYVRFYAQLPGRLLNTLKSLGSKLAALFTRVWDAAKNAVSRGITAVVSFVAKMPGRLLSLGGRFLDVGRAIIGKFVDGIRQTAGVVGNIAGSIWDAIRGKINDAIDRLNDLLEFTIPLPGKMSYKIDPPDIGHLASGGRATGGVLTVIGEGREPETVLPDSLLRGLLERAHDGGAASGVGELRITNWEQGTGYFRLLAAGQVTEDRRYRRGLEAMNA